MNINKSGITINNKQRVILCGSLFYFRINKEDWNERIMQLKYAGYNAIDVYFPWNFHEVRNGEFSFEGQRDIKTFLKLAKAHNMFVVARPGPYICSEYDFGGVPGYLLQIEDIILRDNDPIYLSYVKRYFDHILPILSNYQIGKEGTIIALQIENELDFYRDVCHDPKGYIEALYKMTVPHKFDIPVIACAGQGDEKNATGLFPDVIPTFNFYPHANSHKFEQIAFKKYQELYKRDIPLMVTETNRRTSQLRRLLGSGVKLLGPYNQVGGTNFGLTNAINNWGNPLTYLTSDYNFGGLVGPKGQTSNDIIESKLFAKCLNTHQSYFASATITNANLRYHGEKEETIDVAMNFSNGARVYTVSNFKETTSLKIIWNDTVLPKKAELVLEPYVNRYFFHHYPLNDWGSDSIIDYALCELNQIIESDNTLYIICVFKGEAELMIDDQVFVLKDKPVTIDKPDKDIILYPLDAKKASHLDTIKNKTFVFEDNQEMKPYKTDSISTIIEHPLSTLKKKQINSNQTQFLEDYGVYRGYGYYTFKDVLGNGIYIDQASDIVTVYINGTGKESLIAANTPIVITKELSAESEVVIKSEIWGHTNFHDNRLPALRLDAKRGVHNLYSLGKARTYQTGIKINKNSILVPKGFIQGKILINGETYSFDRYHQVISLEKFVGKNITIDQKIDEIFTIYEIDVLKLDRLDVVREEELIDSTNNSTKGQKAALPFAIELGKEKHISLQVKNQSNRNQYLKVKANDCQLTIIFKNQIVGRLLFISTDKMKMTGGSVDTVYLPGKWFENEIEDIHMIIEGLGNGNVSKIEQYVVKSVQRNTNIENNKEEL